MKLRKSLAVPALLALAVAGASHASTADLSITGTITPSPCSLNFTDGREVSFDNLVAEQVGDSKWAFRAIIPSPFQINCPSATLVTMHYSDLTQLPIGATMPGKNFFLLRTTDDQDLGVIQVHMNSGTGDGNEIMFVNAKDRTNIARPDDESGYMMMGGLNKRYRQIGGTLSINVIGNAVNAPEKLEAVKVSSRIGVELQYL